MDEMLQRLADERDNLLLGEVAALLHQLSKFCGEFIQDQISNQQTHSTFHLVPPSELDDTFVDASVLNNWRGNPNTSAWNHIPSQQAFLKSLSVTLCHDQYRMIEILATYHRFNGTDFYEIPGLKRESYALWLLNACHGAAQVDKGIDKKEGIQQQSPLWIASAFGFEAETFVADDLTTRLQQIIFPAIGSNSALIRGDIVTSLQSQLSHGVGDTRRPINEITLWDWSWSVAALYKAMLAKLLLDPGTSRPAKQTDLSWRTLRVTVDVLGLISQGQRISDTLGYRRCVDDFFARVKQLIEVDHPMGNELYRDSTGIYFTFPGLDEEKAQALLGEIRAQIHDIAVLRQNPELSPMVAIGDKWQEQAQSPESKWEDAPKMLADAQQKSQIAIQSGAQSAQMDSSQLAEFHSSDVCPVCGLRPLHKQSAGGGLLYRQQRCSACDSRAQGALQQWQAGQRIIPALLERETIWLDEIADGNDRVALLIGRFHLATWLDGTLISTLAGGIPHDQTMTPKQSSPARIMRIWRTTEEFWTGSVRQILQQHFSRGPRLRTVLTIDWGNQPPPRQHEAVLDGTVQHMPISLFRWTDETYLTISNPALAGASLQSGMQVRVRHDNGGWHAGTIRAVSDPSADRTMAGAYYPIRTILTTPDQFMALVPAVDALPLANQIAARYAIELGKVRSRLPMDLALVYFHRKMPLYAVIDAARHFLAAKPTAQEEWTVSDDHQPRKMPIAFNNGNTWNISTTFADGSPDNFYPYVAVAKTPQVADYAVDGVNYLHVNRLKPGDGVHVAPSRFSYLWLDNSTRRYSIGDTDNIAPFATQQVPIEEIERLTTMWQKMQAAKITDTNLHGVIQLLLEKRIAWADAGGTTFRLFAADVLQHQHLTDADITAEDVTSGRLFRCFDLHHRLMKQKLAH